MVDDEWREFIYHEYNLRAHEKLREWFPNEQHYDPLIRRYKVNRPVSMNPWKQRMMGLGFGSNAHYNMAKALNKGIPIGKHKQCFAKLVSLGLIEENGLPSDEVKSALIWGAKPPIS